MVQRPVSAITVSPAEKYLGRVTRWLWVRDFIAWKRRGTRGGRIPGETSLARYAEVLERLERYAALVKQEGKPPLVNLDLATCTQVELNAFLDDLRARYELNGYVNTLAIIKDALKFLKRKELYEELYIPARPDSTQRVKDAWIPDDEIEKLIKGCKNLRDRLLVEVFSELGNRRGEMWNLRIKDVQFDEFSAILTLNGKTGMRARRLFDSIPDLRAWLNEHPQKTDPNAPLFLTMNGEPFTAPQGIYQVIKRISRRILGHAINPHRFRHTRATKDSSLFMDREILKLHGWKKHETIAVYSHLTMQDVDNKILTMRGLKSKDDILRPITQTLICPTCHEKNAPIALYCVKCGELLPNTRPEELKAMAKDNEQLRDQMAKVSQDLALLRSEFEKAHEKKITDTTTN